MPLGQITEVRFGVKSGCDAFFFPKDVTAEKLAENLSEAEFKDRYGITKKETEKIRIVHAGDKSQHLIEAEYLEPEIHSLMEIDSFEIKSNELARNILLVSESKDELKGKHVLKYIKWGEREKFYERTTIANRISPEKEWYDLTHERPAQIILPKLQQYRHIISLNSELLLNNSSLLSVYTSNEFSEELCAVLNSTIVALAKQFFGRLHGAEGSLQLDVYSAQMMSVPNPREATSQTRIKLTSAFDLMRQRRALPLIDVDSTDEENWTGELALADRQALDDAVLELVGITDAEERKNLRDDLYHEITKLYRQIRVAEKKMQKFRSATASKGKQTAHTIAEEIWTEFSPPPTAFSPLSFVPANDMAEVINLPLGKAKIITETLLGTSDVQIGTEFISLGSVERSEFVKTLSDLSFHGELEIPVSGETCLKALAKHERKVKDFDKRFYEEAATFSADENMQDKIVKELWKKLRSN